VQIGSISGRLMTIVCVPEMNDDIAMIINPKDFKFASNGFIRQVATPEGHKYYTVRATTGYSYLVDYEVFGELVCVRPAKQLYIHSLPTM
jgi:hypothetical protein